MKTELTIAAGELEQAEFKLLLNKIAIDIGVYKNYMSQTEFQESALYHERLVYQQMRAKHAQTTIQNLFDTDSKTIVRSKHQCIGLVDGQSCNEVLQAIKDYTFKVSVVHSITEKYRIRV